MKNIYYIAAKNLLRWTPEQRLELMDKLCATERERVRREFEKIIRHQDRVDIAALDVYAKVLYVLKMHGFESALNN